MKRGAENLVSRRAVLITAPYATTAVLGLTGILAACAENRAPALSWKPEALNRDQAYTMQSIADLMIPRTETPGALDAGVPALVDRALAHHAPPVAKDNVQRGLDRLNAQARRTHGGALALLPTERQVALIAPAFTAAANDPTHFLAVLSDLVTVCYFTSEPGSTLSLRYDPVPGDYVGCAPMAEIGRAWAL